MSIDSISGNDNLHKWLNKYLNNTLAGFFKLVGEKPPPTKKKRIERLTEILLGDGFYWVWTNLEEWEQEAVRETVFNYANHEFQPRVFAAKHALPLWSDTDVVPVEKKERSDALRLLMPGNRIPPDLAASLRQRLTPPSPARLVVVDELPAEVPAFPDLRLEFADEFTDEYPDSYPLSVAHRARDAGRELHIILRMVEEGQVAITQKTKQITAASQRALGKAIGVDRAAKNADRFDSFMMDQWVSMWLDVLGTRGLVGARKTRLYLTKEGQQLRDEKFSDSIRKLWENWANHYPYDDIERVARIRSLIRGAWRGVSMTAVAERRHGVAQVVAACPVGEWVEIDSFLRYFAGEFPHFTLGYEVRTGFSRFARPEFENEPSGYDWRLVEGRYIMGLIAGYFATLGLVDVAYTDPQWARNDYQEHFFIGARNYLSIFEGLRAFRLNTLGAYVFGVTDTYEHEAYRGATPLRVLATHEIIVNDSYALDPADELFLERIAKPSGDHTWRLDKKNLIEAIEDGVTKEDAVEFLKSRSETPLPDNVAQHLDDVFLRANLLQSDGPAEVYTVADEHTALLIAHDKAMRDKCFLADGNRLVVPANKVKPFRRALNKLGYAFPNGHIKK
ncbi:MAG: hypothetical protein ACLFV4_11510 [Candidatus Hydrogenedentota bacterium]